MLSQSNNRLCLTSAKPQLNQILFCNGNQLNPPLFLPLTTLPMLYLNCLDLSGALGRGLGRLFSKLSFLFGRTPFQSNPLFQLLLNDPLFF